MNPPIRLMPATATRLRGLSLRRGRSNIMAETIIMRGAHAITDPRLGHAGIIPGGAVAITGGTIAETGPFAAISPKYPGARVLGDGTQLLLPGLVDAYSH